jgi:hypothetical protein
MSIEPATECHPHSGGVTSSRSVAHDKTQVVCVEQVTPTELGRSIVLPSIDQATPTESVLYLRLASRHSLGSGWDSRPSDHGEMTWAQLGCSLTPRGPKLKLVTRRIECE